jgi:hypothetical protein
VFKGVQGKLYLSPLCLSEVFLAVFTLGVFLLSVLGVDRVFSVSCDLLVHNTRGQGKATSGWLAG